MKNTKLYFKLSAVVNVLFIIMALILFFNPLRMNSSVIFFGWEIPINNHPYFAGVLIFTPVILFFIAIVIFFWGLWLIAKKIRNKLVIGGLIACLVLFSVLGVLMWAGNERMKARCNLQKPGPCWNFDV